MTEVSDRVGQDEEPVFRVKVEKVTGKTQVDNPDLWTKVFIGGMILTVLLSPVIYDLTR